MLVNKHVGGLEIAMDNGRLGTVQPVHAEGDVLEHAHFLQQGDGYFGIVEQIVEGTARQELSDDGKVTRFCAGSHEQHNIGMAQMADQFH